MIKRTVNGKDTEELLAKFEALMIEFAETKDPAIEAQAIKLHADLIKFKGTCPPCVMARRDLVAAFSDLREGNVTQGLAKIRNATTKVGFKVQRIKAAFGL